ncbi:MAG: histidinol phosphate phosphatase domain-containing protein [Methanosarcinales archaeon]
MIDLHTHSIFSDGELIPSELVRRAIVCGYEVIAITDHVDFSNIEPVLKGIKKVKYLEEEWNIRVIAGVELTHIPPRKIEKLATYARKLGAELIVVHGETPVEPVASGTNKAAVNADIDILAHPGFISIEDTEGAKQNDIYLEITARAGHNMTNGYVAKVAEQCSANLLVNTDAHSPDDLITSETAFKVAIGAGLKYEYAKNIISRNPLDIIKRID